MRATFFFLYLVLIGCSIHTKVEIDMGKISETEKFHDILDFEWEKGIINNPEWATRLGDNRFDNKLNDVSYETVIKRQEEMRELMTKLQKIQRSKLSEDDKLNFDLYLDKLQQEIEGFQYFSYLIPINQMGGIQIGFAGLADYMPFKKVIDYENYISRMIAFPKKVEQTMDLMNRGVDAGWVPPKIVMGSVSKQIQVQFEIPIEESSLYKPVKEFTESISMKDQMRLRTELIDALTNHVYPAYRSLYSYFNESYLPNCRESIACKDFPNGDDYYRYQMKRYTTTELSVETIHEIGLNEVARIKTEMYNVIKQTKFDGTFEEFLTFLRTSPEFYFNNKEELLDSYRVICKKADAALPKFFGLLPRLSYGVKAIPEYQAPASPTAYYYPGNVKAGRPGYFMANTYKLETRPKYEMEALSIHEAVPGHHLQIALAQELEDIPEFRRYGGYTAYIEGWGLYSEKLAEEMGFYSDPYSKFGQLTYEMWRACRLVIDTGIHAKGWTRQEAINFMLNNTAKTENDVVVEIDRYIVWPGQALAYKIGEMKIRELRSLAEKKMGDDFNIRDFHDVVLGDGAVPLNILEKKIKRYIDLHN